MNGRWNKRKRPHSSLLSTDTIDSFPSPLSYLLQANHVIPFIFPLPPFHEVKKPFPLPKCAPLPPPSICLSHPETPISPCSNQTPPEAKALLPPCQIIIVATASRRRLRTTITRTHPSRHHHLATSPATPPFIVVTREGSPNVRALVSFVSSTLS
ncbi:unnamed protein product [Linum trigynum]|uniref:Uncharacterized protein n=1 Tax=Linum trigynum TaxID=586398 RepID=A0AAV2FRU1_9ROSI